MWLAIRKMFMMRYEVNDITMVSESCKRTWHPVWGSIFFCYHERLLKGWKSSLSPPQSLWPNISFFLPLPCFGHNCAVSCKKWQGYSTPYRAFLQRTPTGPAQGGRRPRGWTIWQARASHRIHGYHQIIQNVCNKEQGLQKSVYPQRWGKDISQGPKVTEYNWADSATAIETVWMWRLTSKDRGNWSWRNEWFKIILISIMPDSVALNSSHLQSF